MTPVWTEQGISVFNVLMCKSYKFYICAVVGVIIESTRHQFGQSRAPRIIFRTTCHLLSFAGRPRSDTKMNLHSFRNACFLDRIRITINPATRKC